MNIIGVSGAFGHDAAAALVVDGVIVAACEEERFNRIKRSSQHPAVAAALSCLEQAELSVADVDVLVFGWDPTLAPSDQRLLANRDAFLYDHRLAGGRRPELIYVPHHIAHAASSWHLAGLDEGAVLVADGQGEDVSATIFRASADGLDERARFGIPNSLGFFYAAMTRYLGFGPGSAGKVMGLAAYGTATYNFPELDFGPAGSGVSVPGAQGKPQRMAWWLSRFEEMFGPPGRSTSRELPPQHLINAAASAQMALERSLAELVQQAIAETGSRSLVLSGGVALNCSANGRLRQSATLDDLYVFGAAHDAGTALGAALHVATRLGEPVATARRSNAFLGAHYPIGQVVDQARRLGLVTDRSAQMEIHAADQIRAGKVGGWYRGRSEFGPRALGGRSIVARADSVAVRDRVNTAKGRELWRPLAPALTARAAKDLGLAAAYDYMIEATWLQPNQLDSWAGRLKGALHVDQSMRPLIVADPGHPFFALLEVLESEDGTGAIVNTSFNSEREPMVETPADALRTFASSDLDFLVLENTLLLKPH